MRILMMAISLLTLSFNLYAGCTQFKISPIVSTQDLASELGKARIFNLQLMTAYDDNAQIAYGEVMKIEHHLYKTEILKSQRISDHEYELKLDSGFAIKFSKKNRSLASQELVKVCN